jgi:hypothetical protein
MWMHKRWTYDVKQHTRLEVSADARIAKAPKLAVKVLHSAGTTGSTEEHGWQLCTTGAAAPR